MQRGVVISSSEKVGFGTREAIVPHGHEIMSPCCQKAFPRELKLFDGVTTALSEGLEDLNWT
jgi:hypothetical protein